ncbi:MULTISPECIES: peptidoglycan-binding domain-containing protein [Streptomyces]|uniref:peptidoglycan-binding domain-containing protein n=1 Tax=Streptomyces TaxID=1883 RepID=UPI00214CCB3A|nr:MULTISPECIES: peptidoglycan-binding domain-containing protein [Streptomyces]UUU22876.1 peptidoglycan-binding protein [Streptomyces sp. DSM 40750]
MRLRKIVAATSAAAAAVLVLPATQAQAAAYPTCNGVKNVTYGGGAYSVVQPYHTGSGSRDCIMGYGAQSSAVRKLQDHLINCYDFSGADGIYGRQTEAAVEAVQRREGASVDGEYGPETRKEMLWSVVRSGGGYSCRYPGI